MEYNQWVPSFERPPTPINFIHRIFKDPVSGLTHLAGAFLGLYGLFYLARIGLASGERSHIVSLAVFSVSLVLLYLASSLYHLLHVGERAQKILRQIDHSMIFVFIAGTYTPFCMIPLRGKFGTGLLIGVWIFAALGVGLKIFYINAPRWLGVTLYVFMGWVMVLAIKPLFYALSTASLSWLIAGGMAYSGGSLIYAFKKPDPFPPHFGFHEIWHLCVLAGSFCQFMSVVKMLPTISQ